MQELIKFGWFDARRYLGFNFDSIDVVSDPDVHPGAKITDFLPIDYSIGLFRNMRVVG